VQIDKTIESIQEMRREIGEFAAAPVRSATRKSRACRRSTSARCRAATRRRARVLGTIGSINRYGRPDDFVTWRKGRIEAMTPAGVQQVATANLHPGALTWIVVGDRSKIEAGIRKLDLGEVTVIDTDGKVLK
jgi:predicted Zn-dependent peptidase